MSKETAVAKREFAQIEVSRGTMKPRNFPEMIEFARMLAGSTMVPPAFQGKIGDVLVAIQMGGEIGLSPMAAIQNIAVINGRPSLWGDALLSLIQSHPDCEDVIEELDEKTMTATCTIKRRGRTPTVRTFSKADAETAKLWGKAGPWQQYPKRMLQMRARGFAVRDAFPDALRGLYVAEEAADIVQPVTATVSLTSADFGVITTTEADPDPVAVPEAVEPEAAAEPPEPPPAPDEKPLAASEGARLAKDLRIAGGDDLLAAFCNVNGPVMEWTARTVPRIVAAIDEARKGAKR